jgi:hypothetical protein
MRIIPHAMYGRYNPGMVQNTPSDPSNAQGTRASLSRAISSAHSWQQLLSLAASPAGQQLETPHLAHMLTRLQQLVELQPLTQQEAPLVGRAIPLHLCAVLLKPCSSTSQHLNCPVQLFHALCYT